MNWRTFDKWNNDSESVRWGCAGVLKRGEQNNISFKSNLQLRTIKLLESFHTVLWWRSAETTMRCGSVGGIGGGDTTSKIKFCTEIMFSGNFYCCSMNVCLWIVFQKIWYDRLRCAKRDFQHAHTRTNTIIIFSFNQFRATSKLLSECLITKCVEKQTVFVVRFHMLESLSWTKPIYTLFHFNDDLLLCMHDFFPFLTLKSRQQ